MLDLPQQFVKQTIDFSRSTFFYILLYNYMQISVHRYNRSISLKSTYFWSSSQFLKYFGFPQEVKWGQILGRLFDSNKRPTNKIVFDIENQFFLFGRPKSLKTSPLKLFLLTKSIPLGVKISLIKRVILILSPYPL